MIHQMLIVGIVVAVFCFSLYVLLTTENTIIVVNEAAAEPKEVFVAAPESGPDIPPPNPRIQILETDVGFLNVRDGSSIQAKKVGTVKPGEVYDYTEIKDNWYRIAHPDLQSAWVSGQYVKKVDRSSDLFESE